jgi:hypothetical protein
MKELIGNISCPSYLYIDKRDDVICESAFTVVVGKIDETYRFIPNSNLVLDQGLTPQMLMVIAELIRKKIDLNEGKIKDEFKK